MIWPILIAALITALIYWLRFTARTPNWPGSIVKTLSTALLAITGMATGAPWLVVLGLALGSAGDFALSRPGQTAFLTGMAAFATGHLAYVALMWTPGGVGQIWPIGALMLALAASTGFWLLPRAGALRWPVAGYVLIITAMALAALTLPADQRMMAIGAGLFVLSDLLLAVHLFVTSKNALSMTLWPAYWGGQCLILLGSMPALAG